VNSYVLDLLQYNLNAKEHKFMAVFGGLRKKLSKTREGIVGKIQTLVINKRKIDDELLEEIEEILIGSDISVDVTMDIIERLQELIRKRGYADSKELMAVLKECMLELLSGPDEDNGTWHRTFFNPDPKPYVILVAGVNGTGKTTTMGKLANLFSKSGKKVLLAAADTFRAAACEQLEIWARRSNVDIIRTQAGADPAAVAYDSLTAAQARDVDVLIVDTAGRLHTKINLMNEISKIRRVITKQISAAPHEVLLVLDASTGQNGLAQARQFTDAVGVTGLVLTKLDGTAKGGVIFSIRDELNLPVRFIGLGEGIDDLEEFNPEQFVEALFS
jgi:fused signal recognition particle receptor